MDRKALEILYKSGSTTKTRCFVNKWNFQDTVMGEQYIIFSITSEKPIDWAVGDYCVYRGETYTLNYVPSVTQKAKTNQKQDSYTYESVKFDSHQEELTRITMLDITPTTGDYIAALGTNYTGSAQFQLFCGETSANGRTLTPVCALAAKIQANLDRVYPSSNGWKVYVDTTSMTERNGVMVLNTHTDDKVLTFNNTKVSQALAMVHDEFDLDYMVKGRKIYIGFSLGDLTDDEQGTFYYFGFGRGYADINNQGKALFEIKRIANSSQQIVTRLRALGSKKNLPYRYYNKKYNLSQALFPTNLQLPDTFETPSVKAANNLTRKGLYPYLRDVLGNTNDAYIDKNDDCLSTPEGLREDNAYWDGSNPKLEEIYPTIQEATYGELRAAFCADQDGVTSPSSSFPNYGNSERIDAILQVGDDANIGDGIISESNTANETKIVRPVAYDSVDLDKSQITYDGVYKGEEIELFTVSKQLAGKYIMSPSFVGMCCGFKYSIGRHQASMTKSCKVGYRINIYVTPESTEREVKLATYTSATKNITSGSSVFVELDLPSIPDVSGGNAQISKIQLTETSDVRVTLTPIFQNLDSSLDQFSFNYFVGISKNSPDTYTDFKPEYVWDKEDSAATFMNTPFTVIVKDMGFDFVATFNSSEDPILRMTSGSCVGREFKIGANPEKVSVKKNGKTYKGWKLQLTRAQDDSIYTYFPSSVDRLVAEDHFVLLNVEMPEVYVKMAEVRLLVAASQYLKDNCETKFTYQPHLDEIYLQRNYDNAVDKTKSIYWKLYAGLKFPFYGIPVSDDEDEILPLINITIQTLTIKEGEGLIPKVELTLNNDVEQTTIQKITTAVDRIYNGSIFGNVSGGGTGSGNLSDVRTLIYQICNDRYLSKTTDDSANGHITFKKGASFGKFVPGYVGGSGARIDMEGNGEFESIKARGFIEAPEFRFNRIDVVSGELWNSICFGLIEKVDTVKQVVWLKLEDGELSGIHLNDICRGLFHNITIANATETHVDECGFEELAGFRTSYFTPTEIYENGASFKYSLRPGTSVHPTVGMKFAVYGNFTDKTRQASKYQTKEYDRWLANVDTWVINPDRHIYQQSGLLEGLVINGMEMHGYGHYSHNNYFSGVNIQFDRTILENLTPDVYSVHLTSYECAVMIDIEGNVVESSIELMNVVTGTKNVTANGEGDNADNVVTGKYKLFTSVLAHNGDTPLIYSDTMDEGRFVISLSPVGCTAIVEDGVVYITSIDTAEQDHYVDIHTNCEGNAVVDQRFNIALIPQGENNVTVDLDNEMATFASDDKGNVKVFETVTSNARMWYGNDRMYITKAELVYLPDGIQTNATLVDNGDNTSSLVLPIDSAHANAILKITEFKQSAASTNKIVIRVTGKMGVNAKKLFTKDTFFTLNKAMMGENAINYALQPSYDQIQVDRNNNVIGGAISCYVIATDGKAVTELRSANSLSAKGLSMKVRLINPDDEDSGEVAYNPATSFVIGTDSIGGKKLTIESMRVVFYLYYRNTDGTNVLIDKEGVPLIKDGHSTVRIDLDNENDSVLATQDGTVIASTLPVTHAYLYDGDTLITNKVLLEWQTLVCKKCTASYGDYISDGGKTISVSNVTDENATVIVKCKYLGEVYSTVFSIKKIVGVDKYEIITEPKAVTYDPNTGAYSPDSVVVDIYRTKQNGNREKLSSLPTGYTLKYYIGTTGTAINPGGSIPKSKFSGSQIGIELKDASGVMLDNETVPIVYDGVNGKNTIRVDLDNENDSMLYNGVGELVSGSCVTNAFLYDGTSRITSGIEWTIKTKTNVTATISGNTVTVSAMSANTGSVLIATTYKDAEYTALFTLKKIVGVDKYEIITEPKAVTYDPNPGGGYSSGIKVLVYRTTQNGQRTSISDSTLQSAGYKLQYSKDKGSNWSSATVGNTIASSSFTGAVQVDLRIVKTSDYSVVMDYETVPIVEDGTNGKNGNNTVQIYRLAYNKPSKPSATGNANLPSYWSRTPLNKDGQTVSRSGSFVKDYEEWMKSPYVADSSSATDTLTIVTSEANQAISLEIQASSEANYDFGYIGALDNTSPTTNYVARVSGTEKKAVTIDIPTAGTHTVRIVYAKDRSTAANSDKVSYRQLEQRLWMSEALTFDENGNVTSWSDPVPVDGSNGKDSTSYWLESPIGCINFTHAGYPSPSSFEVKAKKKKGDNTVESASFYFKAWAMKSDGTYVNVSVSANGSTSGYTTSKVSSVVVNVSNTTQYKQYLIKAFETSAQSAQPTTDAVCQIAIGVAIDGESIKGDTGDGVFPRDRGFFVENNTSDPYIYRKVGDIVIRDKVVSQVNGKYYNFIVRTMKSSGGITAKPTLANGSTYDGNGGDSNWELMSQYKTLVVDTFFGNNANIGGFMVSDLNMISQKMDDNGQPLLLLNGKTGKITAKDAVIYGTVYATNGEFKGKVTATSGEIGGFTIASTHIGVAGQDYEGMSLFNEFICFNEGNKRQAILGTWNSVGYPQLMRLTDTSSDTFKAAGIVFTFKNASAFAYDRAFVGTGDGVLNGTIMGYKLNVFTPSSSSNEIPLKKGNRVLVCGTYGICYLPTLQNCRDFLDCGSSTPFCFDLTIIAQKGASYRVYGYVDSTHGQNCPHMINPDSYQDMTGGLAMAEGDTLELRLVYDGSDYRAYIMSHMD